MYQSSPQGNASEVARVCAAGPRGHWQVGAEGTGAIKALWLTGAVDGRCRRIEWAVEKGHEAVVLWHVNIKYCGKEGKE